jgi:transcriptional regulator with GAF, ATPase, and Fis domain
MLAAALLSLEEVAPRRWTAADLSQACKGFCYMPCLLYMPPGKSSLQTFPLFKKITSIGSSDDHDIVLELPEHPNETFALVHFDGKAFHVQQAARRLEMVVNDKKKRKATLAHGDLIEIGPASLRFQLYDEPAAEDEETANQEQLDVYRKLYTFSHELLGNYQVSALLESLMDHIIGLSQADKGFLILVEGDRVDVRVARNMKRETILDGEGQLSDSIVSKVVQTRQPIIVSDALHDQEFSSSMSVISLRLCSVMCVPLIARGTLLGALYVGNDNVVNLFERRHLDVLSIFASQAALVVANALLVNDLQLRNSELQSTLDAMRFGSIIGSCPSMKEVYRKVEKVAGTDVTVLIQGETGTGKELIARELHNRSQRVKGPFITINCGAIPESLLESELFGHVRGAFTGATETRQGRFQLAHQGTIFLDEIGEMPLPLQVKLLRVLQEREVTKVGATRPDNIDIRVVAATNRDLERRVKEGEFREDLFYRLNVVAVTLPPLRERGDDIMMIARFLIQKYCKEFNVSPKGFAPETAIAMRKYAWPGNIRQLENRLKKAAILSEKPMLSPDDLDLLPEILTEIQPLAVAKEDFQRRYINEVLELNGGNRTKTARDLGVDPRTIFRHLEKEGDPTPPGSGR